jgi:hypothetical protein
MIIASMGHGFIQDGAICGDTPCGSVSGYMPELNVLCAIADTASRAGNR